jgi:hypothetical protein
MRKKGLRVNLFPAGPFIPGMRLPDRPAPPAPNVVPLLDVMILLLVFFMLGGAFGMREMEEVRLPQATSMRECTKGMRIVAEPLVINAYHRRDWHCDEYPRGACLGEEHWRLDVLGRDCTHPAAMDSMLQDAKSWRFGGRSIRDRRVVIRSDA